MNFLNSETLPRTSEVLDNAQQINKANANADGMTPEVQMAAIISHQLTVMHAIRALSPDKETYETVMDGVKSTFATMLGMLTGDLLKGPERKAMYQRIAVVIQSDMRDFLKKNG